MPASPPEFDLDLKLSLLSRQFCLLSTTITCTTTCVPSPSSSLVHLRQIWTCSNLSYSFSPSSSTSNEPRDNSTVLESIERRSGSFFPVLAARSSRAEVECSNCRAANLIPPSLVHRHVLKKRCASEVWMGFASASRAGVDPRDRVRLLHICSKLIRFVQAALFRANNRSRLFAKTDVKLKLDSRHFLSIKLGCSLYFYLRYAVSAQSVNASD